MSKVGKMDTYLKVLRWGSHHPPSGSSQQRYPTYTARRDARRAGSGGKKPCLAQWAVTVTEVVRPPVRAPPDPLFWAEKGPFSLFFAVHTSVSSVTPHFLCMVAA